MKKKRVNYSDFSFKEKIAKRQIFIYLEQKQ